MTENKSVSPSRINLLNSCSQKHYYGYTLGLEKPGETQQQALGTAVHRAIEEMYKGNAVPRMAVLEELYAEDFNACVDAYGTFRLLNDRNLKVLDLEKQFEVPIEDDRISDGWTLKGIIDLVCEIDGKIYVMDHKSTKRKWGIEKTALSLQHKIYELVLPELYPNKDYGGSAYNFIQYGSRAGSSYANVTRTFLPRNEVGLQTAWEEVISAIKRIESGERFRNVGDHCGYCEFFTLCQSDYYGGSTESAIKELYVKKVRKNEDDIG